MIVQEYFQDMEIWETVGLWHYSIPGLYLLAQFGLGVLVAMGNLVNNSVFSYLSEGEGPSTNENSFVEGDEKKWSEFMAIGFKLFTLFDICMSM